MDSNDIIYLTKFYKELRNNILKNRKNDLKNNSVLLSLLEKKSNQILRLLICSSIPSFKISRNILNNLIAKKYIKVSDQDVDYYVITVKGIWEIEKTEGIIDEKLLLDFIDNKWFVFEETTKLLSEKEKIILLSMLAARTFSKESPINLKLNKLAINTWKEILEKSFYFLKENEIISKIKHSELFKEGGNERIVSHIIRHTDILPKRTKDWKKNSSI